MRNRKSHQQRIKYLFVKIDETNVAVKMVSNEHSAKVRLWLAHILCIHIHAKFQEYLLYISAVMSKAGLEVRGVTSRLSTVWAKTKLSRYFSHMYTLY